jgi:pimeloyl-ACP methyl ester carboxylesterase
MARLTRPDGAEIHWEEMGEGPLVAILGISYQSPDLYAEFSADLARDHRVVTFEPRGTGRSSRGGPHALETDVDDATAVLEAAGGDALAFCTADGARRATRIAVRRPELVHTVVISGDQPLGRTEAGESEGLADSPAVLDALISLMESDYRAGLRSMFDNADPTMDEEEMRARIDEIERYSSQDATIARLRAWIGDDSTDHGRSLGERLWILHYPSNPWFRGGLEHNRRTLPQAHFVELPDGPMNLPADNAVHVRRIAAERKAAA